MKHNSKGYEELFLLAQKPGRYVGGEYNSYSDFEKEVSFCLCFPDVYEVAISNLGNKIIYHMINESEKFSCERCYSPWVDMEQLLIERDLPLFSLETRTPLGEFDLLGMSLSYEMSYTNMLNMLKLSKIPLKSKDRTEKDPIVFAGGVCVVNPEPFSPFVDFIVLGEGEENLFPVLELFERKKKEGLSREEFLKSVNEFDFVYVPSFHDEIFDEKGKFLGLTDAKIVKKAVVKDFDNCFFPTNQIVANIEAVHDRGVLEVFRGCPRGCRFCQAGFTYRPIRCKTKETLMSQCEKLIGSTGYEEYSLSSLSTGDYPEILPLLRDMISLTNEKDVKMSLPSLRVDSFDEELMQSQRKTSSVTFAPEAGTQRLRNVINKNISDEELEKGLTSAFLAKVNSVKLYFMIGLPTETDEDVLGIFETAKKVKDLYRKVTGRKDIRISVSVANFVPKPFTPFMWEAQDTQEEFSRKHKLLREVFHRSNISLKYHDAFVSKLEGLFALGGRRASKLLELAFSKGCSFDGWTEHFKKDKWEEALSELSMNLDELTKGFEYEDVFPWHFIDVGVDEEFMKRERERSRMNEITGDCMENCLACGATKLGRCKTCW